MTVLDCSVTGCAYNAERCCCKGDIKVEGGAAREREGTCCGSFRQRGEGDTQNVERHASKETEVGCSACSCKFNEDEKCHADHIGIAGGNACTCGETECASFCCG